MIIFILAINNKEKLKKKKKDWQESRSQIQNFQYKGKYQQETLRDLKQQIFGIPPFMKCQNFLTIVKVEFSIKRFLVDIVIMVNWMRSKEQYLP